MTQSTRSWSRIRLANCFAIAGVLIASGERVLAQNQIVPDNTLGGESSIVTPDAIKGMESDRIDGGARRGANLFHSFRDFNVGEGRGAYFANPTGIENILGRVTGGNASNILGTLGVLGEANLFLINPNGIVFGPNARLDVGGAFVGTTASGVRLGETGRFSATEPQTSNLLAIQPSALFFNAMVAGRITNRSQALGLGGETNRFGFPIGLQVPPKQTLALVGGDVFLEKGNLMAAGGRVELGSVAGAGEVSLNQSGKSWRLKYDETQAFGDIRLEDRALIEVSGSRGGDVQIQGARFEMSGGSFVFADTLGSENGGEVFIRTNEAVSLSNNSLLTADVIGSGSGGNITVETGQLILQDRAQIKATAFSEEAGGILTDKALPVDASATVAAIGYSPVELDSSALPFQIQAPGTTGNLIFKARQLIVRDGAQISTITGEGDGGSLTVNASESVAAIGYSADGLVASGLFSLTQGMGAAGDLTFQTRQFSIRDGAVIGAGTFSEGDGGALTIEATESVEAVGTSAVGQISALGTLTILAGDAGVLSIDTQQLTVRDGAVIGAGTFSEGDGGALTIKATESVEAIGTSAVGQIPSGLGTRTQGAGDAGALNIETEQLIVRNGAQIGTATFGEGDAGALMINASKGVTVIGGTASGQRPSGLFTQVGEGAGGAAGALSIETRRLIVEDGAVIDTSTGGEKDAGALKVNASESVELVGTSADGQIPSALSTSTEGVGDAGDLAIATGQLIVRDGAQVNANTYGAGNGGNSTVDAQDVKLIGRSADDGVTSRLSASARFGTGNAGDLTIKTSTLLIQDGAQVNASTYSTGDGGNLTVDAQDVKLIGNFFDKENNENASGMLATSEFGAKGAAGNLTITTDRLLLKDGAQVSAGTWGEKKGGKLVVNATESVKVIGGLPTGRLGSSLNTKVFRSATGDGGNLEIITQKLLVEDGAEVAVESLGTGSAGNMTLNARSIRLNNNALLTANTRSNKVDPNSEQATININSQNLIMRRGSNIRTNATGENVIGGNIDIDSGVIAAVENSDISANSANFRGGNVRINAQAIFGTQVRDVESDSTSDITATGASPDFSGTVEVDTLDTDPDSGLTNLPTVPVDTEVAQTCVSGESQQQSEFIITGRGGLPPNPDAALSSDAIAVDWVSLDSSATNEENGTQSVETRSQEAAESRDSSQLDQIVEAQRLAVDDNGEIWFVANIPTAPPGSSWQSSSACHANENH